MKMGGLAKFLTDHRKTLLSALFAVSAWAFWQDCGLVSYSGVTVDVLALLQRYLGEWVICAKVKDVLQILAAFLGGMGVMDRREWLTNFLVPKPKAP